MSLTMEIVPGTTRYIIYLAGSFDVTRVNLFRNIYQQLPATITNLDLDFNRVESMDAAALAMLFMLIQELGDDMQLRILNCREDLYEVLEAHGFNRVLSIYGPDGAPASDNEGIAMAAAL